MKPQNVFLTKTNIVKLGDFGVAKVMANSLDQAQTMIGTPYYLPPEVWSGQSYNSKADIYSLGAILYEMCMCEKPYSGQNTAQLFAAVMQGHYKPLPQTYPADLRRLIDGMMSPRPMERPSASQILKLPFIQDALKSVQEGHESIIIAKKRLLPDNLFAKKKQTNPPEEKKKDEFEDDFVDDFVEESPTPTPKKDTNDDLDDDFEDDFIDEDDPELVDATSAIRKALNDDEEDISDWDYQEKEHQDALPLNESMTYCIEEIRAKLEDELGIDLFSQVYDEITEKREGSAVNELKANNPPALMLVRRLIDLEEEVN